MNRCGRTNDKKPERPVEKKLCILSQLETYKTTWKVMRRLINDYV